MAGQQKAKQKTVTQDQPNKWHRLLGSPILSWVVPAILTIAGGTFFLFSDYFGLLVDKRIDTKLGSITEKSDTKIQSINDKLDALGQRVAKIEGKLDVLKIQKLAMQPNKATNAKQTLEILNTAKKTDTRYDAEQIADAGKQFISAGVSSSDPEVWKTALAFVDYRSFLNSALAPSTDKFTPIVKESLPWKFKYKYRPSKPDHVYRITTGKKVPAESAAVLEPIGSRLNAGEKVGFEFLLLGDFSDGLVLDGFRLKNIIIKDSKIIYEGGPVEMENVYFVNCTFEVSRRPNGQSFASTVLASAPATIFHAGG